MGKLAVLFAGQGSQYVNMGKDFYEAYEDVRELYHEASRILGYDLTEICFKENTLINETKYTQPSVLVTSLAMYHVLINKLGIKPDVVAGFSLGEYSALFASGVFDFKTIISLINKRAHYMDEATKMTEGKMAAIIGLDREKLETLCNEVTNGTGLVQIANYNCPNQLVVGGVANAVLELCEKAKASGAKRALVLNVSGGFHTPLMSSAALNMYQEIIKTDYTSPSVDIIMNCNALPLDINNLPQLMKQQIESSVYFEDTIRRMIDRGVTHFIEIGPGSVLSGFVKKIDVTKKVKTIDKLDDIGSDFSEFIG